MEDVYERPYDKSHPVVCMDEMSKQQTKEVCTPIPMKSGKVEKYDTQYERNGTSNIFLVFEPLGGKRFLEVTERRTKTDWANFIKKLVDEQYPDVQKVVLVMDNLNTHNGSSLYEAFEPTEAKRILNKLEIHYTPKHGSWLNIAEIELSHLSRQCLNSRVPDREILIDHVRHWTKYRNDHCTTVDWQFKTEDARVKLKRLYPIINEEIE